MQTLRLLCSLLLPMLLKYNALPYELALLLYLNLLLSSFFDPYASYATYAYCALIASYVRSYSVVCPTPLVLLLALLTLSVHFAVLLILLNSHVLLRTFLCSNTEVRLRPVYFVLVPEWQKC